MERGRARREEVAHRRRGDGGGRAGGAGRLPHPPGPRRNRPPRRRRDAGGRGRSRQCRSRRACRPCAAVHAGTRAQPCNQRQGRGYRIRLDRRGLRQHPHAIRLCRRHLEPCLRAERRGCGFGQQLRPRPPHFPHRTLPAPPQRHDRRPRSTRQVRCAKMQRRRCLDQTRRIAERSARPASEPGQRAAGL